MSDRHPAPGESYWYMAGPYSDSPHERYKQHLDAAALLLRLNITTYSPIVHCHPLAHAYSMRTDADFWANHNYNMILSSKGLILLALTNWADSKGVRNELNFCKINSTPVWALDPPDYSEEIPTLNWTRML